MNPLFQKLWIVLNFKVLTSPVQRSMFGVGVALRIQRPGFSVQHAESSVQSLVSRVQHQDSSIKSPTSRVQRPESSVQSPVSRVRRPESRAQRPASRVQSPEFRVQSPDSSVQSPASRDQRPEPNVQLLPPESRNFGMPQPQLKIVTFHFSSIF